MKLLVRTSICTEKDSVSGFNIDLQDLTECNSFLPNFTVLTKSYYFCY